jgi:hypothetical protein
LNLHSMQAYMILVVSCFCLDLASGSLKLDTPAVTVKLFPLHLLPGLI